MSADPSDHSSQGPGDRPDGSIDDDSVHPLTDPHDEATGNIDPVVPLGNAETADGRRTATDQSQGDTETVAEPADDARLMGPAGN